MTNLKRMGLLGAWCLLFTIHAFGQSFSERQVVGTWKVKRVSNQMNPADIPPDKKEIIAKIEKAFLESRFIFQADHKCVFDFSFEEIAVRNGYWNYNNNSSTITIQDWEGKDNGALLLGLQVFVNEDKIYFMVERLPFVLEVEKI